MTMPTHEELRQIIREELKLTNDKVDQMYSIFTGSKNFVDGFVLISKAIILLGAVLGVIYGAIKYLKQ